MIHTILASGMEALCFQHLEEKTLANLMSLCDCKLHDEEEDRIFDGVLVCVEGLPGAMGKRLNNRVGRVVKN